MSIKSLATAGYIAAATIFPMPSVSTATEKPDLVLIENKIKTGHELFPDVYATIQHYILLKTLESKNSTKSEEFNVYKNMLYEIVDSLKKDDLLEDFETTLVLDNEYPVEENLPKIIEVRNFWIPFVASRVAGGSPE